MLSSKYSSAAFPLLLAGMLLLLIAFYEALGLPSPQNIVDTAEALYNEYGYSILFAGAFVEAIFMVSMYLPGSFVIFLAIYFSDKSIGDLISVSAVVIAAVISANVINFILGRYGFYRLLRYLGGDAAVSSMTETFNKYGDRTLLFTGFHPNFLAIATVCAGIARRSPTRTLIWVVVSSFVWVPPIVWLSSVLVNEISKNAGNGHYVILAILLIWAGAATLRSYLSSRNGSSG